ncbi:MAG: hypothetical protein IPK08_23920 [Bacteroidetes bacterium]|nr:hypothetical protein [Bacteroidota bacterium]
MKAALNFGIIFLFMCFEAMSQPVTETILFNNYVSPSDNDLVNNFSGSILLTPVSSNGITGGCLTVPTTESWGNNNAIYCSKYMNSSLYSNDARISFKYDSTLINPINYDRAVTIYLNPIADFNHYVIASITYDKKIQIVSYFAANNPFPVNLIHNHWYEFILSTSYDMPIPALYEVTAEAQLNDLGPTGLTPPIPAGNSDIVFTDSLLYVDTAVGFHFQGPPGVEPSILITSNFKESKVLTVAMQLPEYLLLQILGSKCFSLPTLLNVLLHIRSYYLNFIPFQVKK